MPHAYCSSDVAQLLEVYLNAVVSNVEVEDPDAKAVLDFARAGMLLQGSTSIYSKKVEFLIELLAQLMGFVESGV